jgi:hypothetical protein
MFSCTFLALAFGALFAPLVYGANSVAYNDSSIQFQGQRDTTLGINVGFVFPPANEAFNPPEFIVQIRTTDTSSKWVGIAMFGNMLNCLLLVAWPNPAGNNVVFSTRYTSCVSIYNALKPCTYITTEPMAYRQYIAALSCQSYLRASTEVVHGI